MEWTPNSWRSRPAQQLPSYPDRHSLAEVEACLEGAPPIVSPDECESLLELLSEVANGRGFLLQGGDCAESFAEFSTGAVHANYDLLLQMAAKLQTGDGPTVLVARIAGQYAKPRSSETEAVNGALIGSYRGDIINGAEPDRTTRIPNPRRMLEAHHRSRVILDLFRAFAGAAEPPALDVDAPRHDKQGRHSGSSASRSTVFTSHEALLLPFEQTLCRRDNITGAWWATSAHLLWIGDRTRQLDGAHVEFARGIANPIGLKCGPTLMPEGLLELVERLDPLNRPGRLVLIGRFGADEIERCLPPLLRATKAAGRNINWSIDPMHGNTRMAGGRKTRRVADILRETQLFFDIAHAEGVYPAGVHLEMTGANVTECLGGRWPFAEHDLGRNYLTHCDPRLNQSQAVSFAAKVRRLREKRSRSAGSA